MLIDRARKFLLFLWAALCVGLLAACEGGGGNPGSLNNTPSVATGTLDVVISNLPAGANAAVHITGPGNFTQDLTQSATIPDLAAGTYNVSASSVAVGNATWTPSPASQGAVVAAGASVTATVTYASSTLSLATTVVASGMDNPVFLAAPAGDQRLFIVERPGRIRILQNGGLVVQPFLDLSALVAGAGEGGLLSLAFDPRFGSNGYFYVYYTDLDKNIVVARYTVSPNQNVADPLSGLAIVRIAHPNFTNHFGGLAAFGTDGLLYVGTGDGGSEGDPLANGQNQGTLLGKLLRIDVSAATVGQPYTIPPSNPFVGQAGRRGEIWAWGLRNPWRYAFDGKQLYIADVGQDLREEVDIADTAQGGLNYGWNRMEGTLCFNASTCDRSGLTLPAFEYDHDHGCAIVGGYVYRGTALPELAGRYFYSDFCNGFLKSFLATASGVLEQRDWGLDLGQVVSFGQDGQGELYLMTADGNVDKIIRGAAP
jgi:glucose/arabinose dehydrogenase